ncbi:hypothetical protein B7494_g5955 [Chlorociboria aeruginascens]|nr:hypothetical protein B7494_g5955 [Chlorociboria aeruginascens]
MPVSPQTPRHSRVPSNIDISYVTTSYAEPSPRRLSKTSIHSIHSPTTPNRHSYNRTDSMSADMFSSGGGQAASNGLGNLADELADAWDEDEGEDEEVDMNFQEGGLDGEVVRDSGVDVTSSPKVVNLSPPKGHRRQGSEYDGSDYGGDSDMESPGIPPGLVSRMDMVEGLARRGTEENGTERDGVVKRVIEGLKDLGAQSGVEGGATRLITSHTALSSHLMHQTRLVQSLAYPLFSPLSLPPDSDFVEELLPLLLTVNDSMPRPTTSAFTALTQLHTLTADLVQTLNYLSDTLHMSRQTTTTATRRLKSARELVAEMRKDEDAREEGERWLKRHNWGERLGARECAGVCVDVVGGFEEVCNGWRARLVAQAEAVGA